MMAPAAIILICLERMMKSVKPANGTASALRVPEIIMP